jgi:glycosyltransferase involved in cell wall biosynthesis
MKILYIVSTLKRTGPTNQLYYIVKNMDKSKYLPVILTLSPEPDDTLLPLFEKEKIIIYSLSLSRIKGALFGSQKLKQKIRMINPDVIHSQGLRADELATFKLKNYKRVATLRNYPFDDYPMKFGKLMGNWMAVKHLNTIKKMPNPIACSNNLSDRFKNTHNFSIRAIQNGVDQDRFFPVKESEKMLLRTSLGIPNKKKVFISVGALISRKDPLTVVNAYIKSKASKDGVLIMIGEGSLLEECKQQASDFSNIIFTGSVSNVQEYLQASDYLISASLSEGLPNTVLEALATGIPVILTDILPHVEILNLNPAAGKLVPTSNSEKITDAINEIIDDNYEDAKLAALYIIEQFLNAKVMSNNYQELYKGLVKSI